MHFEEHLKEFIKYGVDETDLEQIELVKADYG